MFDYNDFARSGTAPSANGHNKQPALNRSRPKTRGGSSDLADLNMSLKMDKRNQPENTDDGVAENVHIAIEAWENAKKKEKPTSRQTTRKPSAGAAYKNDTVSSAYTSQFRPVKTTIVSSPRNSNKAPNVTSRVAEIRAIYGMSEHPTAPSGRSSASAARKKPRTPATTDRPRSSAPDVPKSQRKTSSRKILTKEEEKPAVAEIPPPPAEEPHFFEASPEVERPESRKLYLGQPIGSPKAVKPAIKAPRSAGPVIKSSQQTSLKEHVDAESSGMVRTSSFAGFVRPALWHEDDIDSQRPPSRQKSAFPTHLADMERVRNAFEEPVIPKDDSVKVGMESPLHRPPSRQRLAAQNLFDSSEPPPTAPHTAKPKLTINTTDEVMTSVSPMASASSLLSSPTSHPPFISSDSDAQLLAQVESMNLLPCNDTPCHAPAPRPAPRAWLNSSSGTRKEPTPQPTTRPQPTSVSSSTPNRDRVFQASLAPRYDPHADGFADLDVPTPSTFKIEVNYAKQRCNTAKAKGRKSPIDAPVARPKSMVATHHLPVEAPQVSQTASGTRRHGDDEGSAWGMEKKRDGEKKPDRDDMFLRKINSDEQSENVSYLSCSPNIVPDDVYDDDDLTIQSGMSEEKEMQDMTAASLQSFMLESSLGEDFLSLFAQNT